MNAWERKHHSSMVHAVDNEDVFDIRNDEEQLRRQIKSRSVIPPPAITMTQDQLDELRQVTQERLAAERLRKMGIKPKESLGLRYERI